MRVCERERERVGRRRGVSECVSPLLPPTPSLGLASRPRTAFTRFARTNTAWGGDRDWHVIAEQPAPAPHLARPEGRAALTRWRHEVRVWDQGCGAAQKATGYQLARISGQGRDFWHVLC